VTSSTVCDVSFELARHEFHLTFYVLRDLRAVDLILGLPWLDDEHASLQFGSTKVFTMMDGTSVDTTLEERRPECLLMSSTKVQKLMRKTRRSRGRNAEFYVIELTPTADQPADFHTEEELTTEQRDNFRSLLYDDFPELLQHVDSPHVSRQWDHPIATTGPMRRQRLNRLSHAERVELNRQLKDAVEAGLIRPSYIEFGSPILFVRKADGSLCLCIDYRSLNEVTRKDAYPLPRVDDTLDELKDANFYTHLDLASGFWRVRVRDKDIHKTAFQTPNG
jgi:phosphoglycolate phosphatase-like HAD superfamily hydrolase